ncbi:testis-specific serine/threonine-protein kinase 3-like [Trichogramma pretiosum]|uniref:testis-specific serine/threonine-protein kinase 3-like n=1 Tax=Trichogramma pretiosum TaxID=7493 RepID=UPI0006C9C9D8|nr:testis-specific serine/threonine-protein kinase 3-like [Trichogramma pretiosum]
MATDPANEAQSSNCHATNEQEQDATRAEKKLTVLESHGFILGKTIGAGNYATVKIARSEKHGCDVAVKIVSKFLAPSANLNTYLPREVQVIKRLRHANIIRFLQAIETSHRVYIIMEYAENGSLIDIIRRDKNIDEERSRRWFRQLLNVLAFCHERGIVHRDVKCENLLMDRYYNLKLSDFGFARGQMKSQDGVAPLSETFCGSFAYASPEILRGIPYKPQLSDIWAAGVVLYTMVFGRLPFDESVWSKLLKQVQSKVVFPDTPKVSRPCRALIVRILVPQRLRPQIPEILSDEWMAIPLASAQTSTNDIAFVGEGSEPEKSSPKTIESKKSSDSNKSIANDEKNNETN